MNKLKNFQYWKFFNLNFEQDGSRWNFLTLNSPPYKAESHDLMSCLFCFVLFVTPRDLSNHGTSCCALLVSSESSQWLVGVHWLGLRLFGATVQKLLIIEPFFQSKSNQNQNYKLYWNLRVFFISLESSEGIRFIKVYFTISRAKVWKILIFEWILLLEIQTNYKNWVLNFWTEKSVEPLMCSHLGQW
jgi:hypothetical protein